MNFLLGYNYYGSIAKDTVGLLKFIKLDRGVPRIVTNKQRLQFYLLN